MSSWGKIFWLLWRPLFIPEVMVLSGLVGIMSQLAGPLKKQLKRAAFGILRDIMDHFPQELAAAIVGVFPRGNPSTDSWQQARGRSLEIGAVEAQNSDNPAMSAMFTVMKAFDGVEGSLRRVSGALGQARDDQRQLQRDHDAEIERVTVEMAQLTRQRDQAT
jgi:hypothetical protein